MILRLVRYLRHGPLKFLSPLWLALGVSYRALVSKSNLYVNQYIAHYGPFKLDARFAFSNFSQWGGGHNDGFIACVEACRYKNCVVDVGAHIGLVTLPALSVMRKNGTLVAFEPSAGNRKILSRHLKLNQFDVEVKVVDSLLGATKNDAAEFFETNNDSGMNTTVRGAMGHEYHAVTRRQITLDDFCANFQLCPDLIKIDVEGAELDVLAGAKNVIAEHRPLIFLSVHPRQIRLKGQSLDQLIDFLESLNYQVTHADGSRVVEFALREYILTPRENLCH